MNNPSDFPPAELSVRAEPTRTARTRNRILYAACAAALALALGVTAIVATNRHAVAANTVLPAPALTVTSAMPHHASWSATLEASGAIAPWQEASLGTQIGGYQLIDVRVNVGDQVKKGQVLARLDPALLLADEAQLQANVDQAEANRQRALTLKSGGGISDQDVLQFVTQAKTANALLASKQLQLRYTDVIAPDDGVISSRMATLGAVVPVGQELFRLIRQNRLEWRGELTAPQLALIEAGQRIALTLPDGSSATAKVRQTAPSLDAQSRLGTVYADLEPGSRARAGMYASGQVVLSESPALVIPAESVVIRDGRSYVLKLADASATPKVSLQAVTVGRREGGDVEIVQGLAADDRVVVQGAGFLNEGDVVRLADERAPAASTPPAEKKG
jgi:RND family efflux transporter MFP subunit